MPAPPWVAADKETAAAAEATAHEWVACINADDNLRLASLMTDSALTRFFAGVQAAGAMEEAQAVLAGTPEPRAEEERAQIVTVSDVSRLDDGRIVALADIKEPAARPSGQESLLLVFTPSEDRMLIDDIIQFSLVPGGPGRRSPPRRSRRHKGSAADVAVADGLTQSLRGAHGTMRNTTRRKGMRGVAGSFLVLMATMVATLLVGSVGVAPAAAQETSSLRTRVKLLHADPSVEEFEVFIDGVEVLEDFAYGQVSDWIDVAPGSARVTITADRAGCQRRRLRHGLPGPGRLRLLVDRHGGPGLRRRLRHQPSPCGKRPRARRPRLARPPGRRGRRRRG